MAIASRACKSFMKEKVYSWGFELIEMVKIQGSKVAANRPAGAGSDPQLPSKCRRTVITSPSNLVWRVSLWLSLKVWTLP